METHSHYTSYILTRIQTSYVSVEPKKRREYGPTSNVGEKSQGSPQTETGATAATTEAPETIEPSLPASTALGYSEVEQPVVSTVDSSSSATAGKAKSSSGTLRRARIVITVKRTDAYKKPDPRHSWRTLRRSYNNMSNVNLLP